MTARQLPVGSISAAKYSQDNRHYLIPAGGDTHGEIAIARSGFSAATDWSKITTLRTRSATVPFRLALVAWNFYRVSNKSAVFSSERGLA